MADAEPMVLEGKRIVITRAAAQSKALAQQLAALGAIPVTLPLVAFAEPEDFVSLDAAIASWARFDWVIFTSGQAVHAVVTRAAALKIPLSAIGNKPVIGAVGPVSADVVRQLGLLVEYVAKTNTGVALAEELGERLRGRKVLLPRSDRANPDLPAALKRLGAQVSEVVAYRTLQPADVDEQNLARLIAGEADAILFFSPSAVQHFTELAGGEKLRVFQERMAITAIGPVTANALRKLGAERIVVAADATAEAVVDALVGHFARLSKKSAAGVKRG